MSDVFISHVEEDESIALEIAAELEAAGYTTWYYERDSLPGVSYLLQTKQAVEAARAVIVIISPNSLGSPQMTKEVVRAHESDKHVLPVLREVTHAAFQQRQPEWWEAMGAAASVRVPPEGVRPILPRILAGLRGLDVLPASGEARAVAELLTRASQAIDRGAWDEAEQLLHQVKRRSPTEPGLAEQMALVAARRGARRAPAATGEAGRAAGVTVPAKPPARPGRPSWWPAQLRTLLVAVIALVALTVIIWQVVRAVGQTAAPPGPTPAETVAAATDAPPTQRGASQTPRGGATPGALANPTPRPGATTAAPATTAAAATARTPVHTLAPFPTRRPTLEGAPGAAYYSVPDEVVGQIAVAGPGLRQIAVNDSAIWVFDDVVDTLYRYDRTGTLDATIPYTGTVTDVAWDGEYLRLIGSGKVVRVSVDDQVGAPVSADSLAPTAREARLGSRWTLHGWGRYLTQWDPEGMLLDVVHIEGAIPHNLEFVLGLEDGLLVVNTICDYYILNFEGRVRASGKLPTQQTFCTNNGVDVVQDDDGDLWLLFPGDPTIVRMRLKQVAITPATAQAVPTASGFEQPLPRPAIARWSDATKTRVRVVNQREGPLTLVFCNVPAPIDAGAEWTREFSEQTCEIYGASNVPGPTAFRGRTLLVPGYEFTWVFR